ncbi:MAG: hypothetical protein ABIQ18_42670, partial [Umezawaea sp.]
IGQALRPALLGPIKGQNKGSPSQIGHSTLETEATKTDRIGTVDPTDNEQNHRPPCAEQLPAPQSDRTRTETPGPP